jgi:hypothetical protein
LDCVVESLSMSMSVRNPSPRQKSPRDFAGPPPPFTSVNTAASTTAGLSSKINTALKQGQVMAQEAQGNHRKGPQKVMP